MHTKAALLFAFVVAAASLSWSKDPSRGIFDGSLDIGNVSLAGSTVYDSALQKYTLSGSGVSSAGGEQVQFAWKRIVGNCMIRARIVAVGSAGAPKRIAGCMVRSNFDTRSPMVLAGVLGSGGASLQSRTIQGGAITERTSSAPAPTVIQLERKGTTCIISAAAFGETFARDTITNAGISDTAYIGICASSSDSLTLQTIAFRNVQIVKPAPDNFKPYADYYGTTIEIVDVDSGYSTVLYSTSEAWQAPNLKKDNATLLFDKTDGTFWMTDRSTRPTAGISTFTRTAKVTQKYGE